MSLDREFATVAAVLGADAPTKTVDAFALSVIKVERQVRKIFTFLMYQFPVFSRSNRFEIGRTLAAHGNVYFEGLVKGVDAVLDTPVSHLVGDRHDALWARLDEARRYRNKI